MPRIKMVEANGGLTLANLTFDNVADYRGVPLTERQPNGWLRVDGSDIDVNFN